MNIEEIRARCEKASPGPWKTKLDRWTTEVLCGDGLVAGSVVHQTEGFNPPNSNAVFIAHAREDIPALLARVDALEAALSVSRAALVYIRKDLKFCIDDGGIHATEVLTADRALESINAVLPAAISESA